MKELNITKEHLSSGASQMIKKLISRLEGDMDWPVRLRVLSHASYVLNRVYRLNLSVSKESLDKLEALYSNGSDEVSEILVHDSKYSCPMHPRVN